MLPVPVGDAAHGTRPQLHDGRRPDASAATAAAGACCDRWASTRSACRPRTQPSARAAIRARSRSSYIDVIRAQMKRLGWAIDWDREVSAHEVGFYHWTQWLFLRFFERGLAYRKAAPVNWCPNDQTVVANEHVIDGRCGAAARRSRRGTSSSGSSDHRLRRRAARVRPAARRRLARADEDDPAQLDRPLGGRGGPLPDRRARRRRPRLHDAARHAVRRDVLRPRARASARRADRDSDEVRAYAKQTAARRGEERATRTRRRASSPAATRRTLSTTRGSPSTSPTTC